MGKLLQFSYYKFDHFKDKSQDLFVYFNIFWLNKALIRFLKSVFYMSFNKI